LTIVNRESIRLAAVNQFVLSIHSVGQVFLVAAVVFLAACARDGSPSDSMNGASGSGGAASTDAAADGGASAGVGGKQGHQDGGVPGAGRGYPTTFDPNDSPPKIAEPGCGFELAAFCDTFGGPSKVPGRGGELDAIFWSASRMLGPLSKTHAMAIGMAKIPECRPDLPSKVWPDQDSLICHPTFDLMSGHLLLAAAAQNYGQNGYRIRQPFDFSGRTGKIVFDASSDPLNPLIGWLSLAVTEDPSPMPGYAILGNDEGSIIPRNALEVHFANYGGSDKLSVRQIHVFKEHVDTMYETPSSVAPATHALGKVNHYEFSIAQDQIEVRVSPFSEDGVTFGEPTLIYKQQIQLPMTRGYVHLSLHNHASIKYTQPDSDYKAVVDAVIARVDNIGFDGPVIANWREYEVPDSLVKFTEPQFQEPADPYNTEHQGVDVGYFLQDTAKGPGQVLKFKGVDMQGVAKARLALSLWVITPGKHADYTLKVRLNGNAWISHRLTAAEAKALDGPLVLDPSGKPVGQPGTQGRLGMTLDLPLGDLVAGDNTLELVTANIASDYPPIVGSIDLIQTLE
jgi:hypothetical protein